MASLLLISDDLRRTERLARDLSAAWVCRIYDLYEDGEPTSGTPTLIVSDVRVLTSEAILRLRRLLERVRGPDVPYLCLLHDDSARTQAHCNLLGASDTLSASVAPSRLVSALIHLQELAKPVPVKARQYADSAQQFLREVFVPDRAITPELIDTGTGILTGAIRDLGIRAWVRLVRRFDDATHQHCLLVAGLACAFSKTLGLHAADSHRLSKAALLHDVGKIHIPTAILNKPGKLDEAETAVMRTHSAKGHAMLVGKGFDDALLAVVRSHHEMLDGSGYPDRLRGSQIPDFVRLVTICDVYGALIEDRPYRAPMPSQRAMGVLNDMRGRLDPDLVSAFEPIADQFSAHKSTRETLLPKAS